MALCQFRDNIWLATECPAPEHVALMEHIRHVLKTVWDLEVECDCIGPWQKQCTGSCCAPVRKAVGAVMAVQPPGERCAFVEPAALKPDWSLRMQAPLMTPCLAYQGYLGNIMTSVLKNGLPWTRPWLGQIMSALAWLQVMLLSGYKKSVAMRAIHKGIHRAYDTSPHAVQAMVKCVHSVVHHMPAKRCVVLTKVHTWLHKHAVWEDNRYTSWVLPPDLTIDGINGAWNDDMACIQPLREASCSDLTCPRQQQHNVCM